MVLLTGINYARVDFVTLRLFCEVVKAGSITKGAERSNLALSAASRRLSEFESVTGSPLLERTAQGVVLTSAGHVAMQHAMRLIQGLEHFSSEMNEHVRGARGHVRLWANMSALSDLLPSALASFYRKHPDIRVEVEEQLSGDTARAIVEGLADVGVFAEGTPAYGLNPVPFQIDELVVACSREHMMATVDCATFRECLAHDFVGLNRHSSLLKLITHRAEDEGLPLRLRVQARSFDAMCQMIAVNLGIGILPRAALEPMRQQRNLEAIRLEEPWALRKLLVATKSGATLTPAATLLVEHLRRAAMPRIGSGT